MSAIEEFATKVKYTEYAATNDDQSLKINALKFPNNDLNSNDTTNFDDKEEINNNKLKFDRNVEVTEVNMKHINCDKISKDFKPRLEHTSEMLSKPNGIVCNKDLTTGINETTYGIKVASYGSIKNIVFSDGKHDTSESMNEGKTRTELQNFYHGKSIFITGGTGFLGKMLVEKLLRSCPGIDNVYLLVRQKKGKDVYTRIEEVFEDPVFDRLKQEFPKFRHKIVVVPGDCGAPGLGLVLHDQHTLLEKVNVIFHAAATVKFDEQLRSALATNVQAPLHLLILAKQMHRLMVLVHVSTAYSNCHLQRIEERLYECPVDHDGLQRMIDKMDDAEIDRILPTILGVWPNTYTFSKALAEKEVTRNCKGLPVAIFRPAIVTSTAKEPIPAWIDNMYGPTGVVAGAAAGVLRTLECDASVTADVVPVDSVVNCLIACANHVYKNKGSGLGSEPPVFNYVSSVENRITWGDFMLLICKYSFTHPLSSAIWYNCITLNKSSHMNALCKIFLHLLPALLVDGLAMCVGQKPKLLKVYKKIHKFSSVLSYFTTHEIQFCNRNVRALWEQTSDADKQLYPFSMRQVDWVEYFSGYLGGIRTHLFKESEGTLNHARTKWNRLYYLHQLVKTLFICAFLYVIWYIFTNMLFTVIM